MNIVFDPPRNVYASKFCRCLAKWRENLLLAFSRPTTPVSSKFQLQLLFACSVVAGSPDLLVAIDQHAAHERVRLESLMEGIYCVLLAGLQATYPPCRAI